MLARAPASGSTTEHGPRSARGLGLLGAWGAPGRQWARLGAWFGWLGLRPGRPWARRGHRGFQRHRQRPRPLPARWHPARASSLGLCPCWQPARHGPPAAASGHWGSTGAGALRLLTPPGSCRHARGGRLRVGIYRDRQSSRAERDHEEDHSPAPGHGRIHWAVLREISSPRNVLQASGLCAHRLERALLRLQRSPQLRPELVCVYVPACVRASACVRMCV
jgi:hypothetical protein